MSFTDRLSKAFTRRVWIHALRRFQPETEVQLHGKRLRIDLRDTVVSTLLYLEGEYESEVQRLMQAIGLEGGVCTDIGAHIGSHTLEMSRLVGPRGRVFAFEPQSRNFELLEKNVRLNGASNVIARHAAVGDRQGVCRLAVNAVNHGDHRVSTSGDGAEEVPMLTIDSALREVEDGAVRLIKIDVQGYETYVVRGLRETLRRNPEAVLFIEIFPEGLHAAGSSAAELVGELRDLGLDGWEFHDFRLIPCQAPHIYDLIRGGKYADLVLSRKGQRITGILERFYGQPLVARKSEAVMA